MPDRDCQETPPLAYHVSQAPSMTAGSGFNVDSDMSPSIKRKKELQDSARKTKDFKIPAGG